MNYKIRDYFILTDDAEIHHTRSTQITKYQHSITLHTDITHRETQIQHFHSDTLLTNDLSKITEDVIEKFIERCKERCEAGNFEINSYEIKYIR